MLFFSGITKLTKKEGVQQVAEVVCSFNLKEDCAESLYYFNKSKQI